MGAIKWIDNDDHIDIYMKVIITVLIQQIQLNEYMNIELMNHPCHHLMMWLMMLYNQLYSMNYLYDHTMNIPMHDDGNQISAPDVEMPINGEMLIMYSIICA